MTTSQNKGHCANRFKAAHLFWFPNGLVWSHNDNFFKTTFCWC